MIRVIESYDKSKYKISYFTPEEYDRLKKCVDSNNCDGNNTFGFIETKQGDYSIDVICDEINGQWVAEWNVYEIGEIDNDNFDGGDMDLSLSYDEQVNFLIDQLEESIKRLNHEDDPDDYGLYDSFFDNDDNYDVYDESYLKEFYNQPLHDKLKQDGYSFVGSQGGWYCYVKNSLGGGRPKYKAFPTNADSVDEIREVSYEQVKGKDPMPYDIDAFDYYDTAKGDSFSWYGGLTL